jgi:hypothetical protein
MEAAIMSETRHATGALLIAKKGAQGRNGGNGGKAGKGGRSPKRDKRDDKRDYKDERKERDLRMWFHCLLQGHITENYLSKQSRDSSKAVDTTAKALTEALATWTLTTLIENYWMVASSNASSSEWLIR